MKEEGKGEKEYEDLGREGMGKKDERRGERGEGMGGLGKRGKGKEECRKRRKGRRNAGIGEEREGERNTIRRITEVGNKNKGLVGKRGEIKVWGEGEVNWGKLL